MAKHYVLAIVLLTLFLSGCFESTTPTSTSTSTSIPKAGFTTYTDASGFYQIDFPTSWKKYVPPKNTEHLASFSDPNAYLSVGIKIYVNQYSTITLDDYTQDQIAYVTGYLQSKIIEQAKTTLSGYPAYRITYSSTAVPYSISIWTVNGNKVYRIDYQGPETDLDMANYVISSFKVLN